MLGLVYQSSESASMIGFGHDARFVLDGSMLDPNCVIAEDVKSCTVCCYIKCVTLIVRVGCLVPKQRNSSRCIFGISRFGCLLCSMARIYDQWDGSLDKRKVYGLVPCCCQDGYLGQVPQHPIDS